GLVGLQGRWDRWVLVNIVRAEPPAAIGIGVDGWQRAGGNGDKILFVPRIQDPHKLGPVLGFVLGRLVGDDQQVALEQRNSRVHEARVRRGIGPVRNRLWFRLV